MKSFSKSIIIFILFFILFINISIPVSATTFTPQIGIGEFKSGVPVEIQGNSIGRYILAIYNYSIGVIGIIAVIVMMVGGVMLITASGRSERVTEAKAWIGAAILGLILLLSSYTILNTINPNLTRFNPINPMKTGENKVCCDSVKGSIPPVCTPNNDSNSMECSCPNGTSQCAQGLSCALNAQSNLGQYTCLAVTNNSIENTRQQCTDTSSRRCFTFRVTTVTGSGCSTVFPPINGYQFSYERYWVETINNVATNYKCCCNVMIPTQ
jgi:hypothetical protein